MTTLATAFQEQEGKVIITTFVNKFDVAIAYTTPRPGEGVRDLLAFMQQVPLNGEPPERVVAYDGTIMPITTQDHATWRRQPHPYTEVGFTTAHTVTLMQDQMLPAVAEYFGAHRE